MKQLPREGMPSIHVIATEFRTAEPISKPPTRLRNRR